MENQILAKVNITDATMDDVHLKIQKIYKVLTSEIGEKCQLSQNIKNQIFDLIKLIENIRQNNPNGIESFPKIDTSNNILFNHDEICASNIINFKFQNFIRSNTRKRFVPILLFLKRIGDMNSIFNFMYQINEIKCLSKAIEFLSLSSQSTNCLSKAKILLQLLIEQRKQHLSRRMSLIAHQEKYEIPKFISCPNINLYFEGNDSEESTENEINSLLYEATPNSSTTSINVEMDNEINHAMENAMPSQILTTSTNTESEKEINDLLTKLISIAASQQKTMQDVSKAILFCVSEENSNRIHLEAERILLMLNLHYLAFVEELKNADSVMEYQNLGQCKIRNVEFYFDPKNLDENYNYWFIIVTICGSNIFVSEILSADENGCIQCFEQIQLKNLKESDEVSVELYSCKIKKNKFWLFNKFHQILNILKGKENIGDNHESLFGLLAKGEIANLKVLLDTVDLENIQEFFIHAVSKIIPHVQCSLFLYNE